MELALSWAAVSAAAVACFWLKLAYQKNQHGQAADLDDVRERLEEMQALCADVAEQVEQLHERVDFAERLLTSRRDQQLPIGEEVATPV